jgi:hypothetical protein
MPHPISVVLITLDAERSLEACLRSVTFADEIVVVDSGSRDQTRAIAARYGARVIEQAWLGFGPQKRFAVAAARNEWVLCIDADEQVSPTLRASIEAEMSLATPRATAFECARCNRFMGRWLRHGEGYPDWSLRFFRRDRAGWTDSAVHERVDAVDRVLRLGGDLLHDSAETLERYMAKQSRYADLLAPGLRHRGALRNGISLIFSPLVRFVRFYVLRAGFLDGWPGLVHIAIGSATSGAKYWKALRRAPL